MEGRTDLPVLANGTLTAVRYQDEILGAIVRPYAGAVVLGSSWCRIIPDLMRLANMVTVDLHPHLPPLLC